MFIEKELPEALKKRFDPQKGLVLSFAEMHSIIFEMQWRAWAEKKQRIEREQWKKLDQLAEKYGISQTDDRYAKLALRLAQEFVPGFGYRYRRKRGAPKKWPNDIRGALVVEIDALCKPGVKGKGPTNAAKLLSKREPWSRMVKGLADPVAALLNVYKKAKRNEGDLISRVTKMKERLTESQAGGTSFDQLVADWIDKAVNSR